MVVQYNKINFAKAKQNTIEKFILKEVKKQFPKSTFKQREYLFFLYTNKKSKAIKDAKRSLFNKPTVYYLLNKKVEDVTNLFDEKQNDTADILVVKDDFYEIIDTKTRNISKSAQPPNIISAFKLAQVCAKMLDNKEFNDFTINYFEVDWELVADELICRDAHVACLFKANPENLYINWAAAMQIQFHVCDLDQSFKGTMEQWTRAYLKHFVAQVYKRSEYMINEFAKPFEKYII